MTSHYSFCDNADCHFTFKTKTCCAGFHSASHEAEYKEACIAACTKAMKAVKGGLSAKEIVTIAISTLEDIPCTNAGIGSNLTRSGTVECDACIMDGQSSAFGAVGMRNPIQVACKLLDEELKGPLDFGLIPPIFLVGEGAFHWAVEHGFNECHNKDLITGLLLKTGILIKGYSEAALVEEEELSGIKSCFVELYTFLAMREMGLFYGFQHESGDLKNFQVQ